MKQLLKVSLITAIGSTVGLTACSSGSGSGPGGSSPSFVSTQAEVTANNSQDLAVAGTEAAIRAVRLDESDDAATAINQVAAAFSTGTATAAATVEGACPDGGSLDQTNNLISQKVTLTFSSCDKGAAVFNGTVEASPTLEGTTLTGITMTFTGFTITPDAGDPVNLDGTTISCSFSTTQGLGECTLTASNVQGANGKFYQIGDFDVDGNSSSGFTITTTVSDTQHGQISVTTNSPLFFECENDRPSAGMITITGSNGSTATINFDSCTQFTVTFNGSPTTYTW